MASGGIDLIYLVRRLKSSLILSVLILAQIPYYQPRAESQESLDRKSRIEAAIIYQTTKFLTFSSSLSKKLVLCNIGNSLVNKEIRYLVQDKEVRGRTIDTMNFPVSENCNYPIESCAITVVDLNLSIFDHCTNENLLFQQANICISDTLEWERNCMVRIFEDNNKARLAVDLDLARKYDVQVSAELLALAEIKGELRPGK